MASLAELGLDGADDLVGEQGGWKTLPGRDSPLRQHADLGNAGQGHEGLDIRVR